MDTTSLPTQIIDLSALRIPPQSRNTEQRKAQTLDIKIGKPRPDAWVQIHPLNDFRWEGFWAYEKDKQYHLLSHSVYCQLEEQVQRVFAESDFYLTAVLNGEPIVWPVKHSETDWYRTLREATQSAFSGWVQVQSNMRTKRYDCRSPQSTYDAPDWSAFGEGEGATKLFNQVFGERLILDNHHQTLERIRGVK